MAAAEQAASWYNVPLHKIETAPDTLFEVFGFPVTNTITLLLVQIVLIALLCLWARSFKVKKPSKIQLGAEMLVEWLYTFYQKIVSKPTLAGIIPIVTSVTLFLLISNLITILIPFLPAFTVMHEGKEIFLFRIYTSDLNATLGLAFALFLVTQVYGVIQTGIFSHTGRYLQFETLIKGFKKGGIGIIEGVIGFFVGILEIISDLAKILSICLRLFGNIFAGEILLAVMLSIFGAGLPVPILVLGLLVGGIQALVFGSLTAAKMAEFGEKPHH